MLNINVLINIIQNLAGETIHDDGASNHVRYNEEDFIELKLRSDVNINGITGIRNNPYMGKVQIDEQEVWDDVVLANNMNYNIDSEFQLVEVNGWTKDLSIKDPRE